MSTKRKPETTQQLLTRTDRRHKRVAKRLTDIEATLRLDHQIRALNNATMKTQLETIRRLLRQHDTLKHMPSWPRMERELIAANAYLAEPLKTGPAIPAVPTLTHVVAKAVS